MNECEVNKKKLSEKKNTATTSGNVGVMLCNYADHVSRIVLFHNEFFFFAKQAAAQNAEKHHSQMGPFCRHMIILAKCVMHAMRTLKIKYSDISQSFGAIGIFHFYYYRLTDGGDLPETTQPRIGDDCTNQREEIYQSGVHMEQHSGLIIRIEELSCQI